MLTEVMTECPSLWVTKSLTALEGAVLNLLPPMKCAGRACLSCHDLEALALWPLTPFVAGAMIVVLAVYHAPTANFVGFGTRARRRPGKGDKLMGMTSSVKGGRIREDETPGRRSQEMLQFLFRGRCCDVERKGRLRMLVDGGVEGEMKRRKVVCTILDASGSEGWEGLAGAGNNKNKND